MATFKQHFYLLIFLLTSFAINQSVAAQQKTELKHDKIKVKNVDKGVNMMDRKPITPLDTTAIERIMGNERKSKQWGV